MTACELPMYRRSGELAGVAIVDPEDYEWASQFKWSLSAQGYAVRKKGGRKGKVVLLHRELLGCEKGDGVVVDHINGDRLDCRRSNMRKGDYLLNGQNVKAIGGSRYRGVSWINDKRKWRAAGRMSDGRYKHLGYFADEDAAGEVALEWRRQTMPGYVER